MPKNNVTKGVHPLSSEILRETDQPERDVHRNEGEKNFSLPIYIEDSLELGGVSLESRSQGGWEDICSRSLRLCRNLSCDRRRLGSKHRIGNK